ncbi:hypothetical protein [Phascolarctobacterium sp.]|uniref:hypothetical protein n=1 Tax=Phascolarctobacterium sp. TaxID=2049039 RepID=UPI00386A7C0A
MKTKKLIYTLFLGAALFLNGCASPALQPTNTAKQAAIHDITAPATGKVLGLIAEKGERISKDQPLFAISDAALDGKVKDLSTKLAKAEAELKRLQNGTINAQPAADTTALQMEVAAAQQKAAKMNNLLAQGAVSRNQAQAAQVELQQATARLQAASQANTISVQPASPQAIKGQQQVVDMLKLQLAQAKEKQQGQEAPSPCTGTIVEIKAQNNQDVEQGQVILQIKEEE